MRLTIHIALFALVLLFMGTFLTPAPSRGPALGPYQSALTSVGVGTAWAAKRNNCNSFCEFIAPGYHCLNEGVNEKCVTGTGGCTTVACP